MASLKYVCCQMATIGVKGLMNTYYKSFKNPRDEFKLPSYLKTSLHYAYSLINIHDFFNRSNFAGIIIIVKESLFQYQHLFIRLPTMSQSAFQYSLFSSCHLLVQENLLPNTRCFLGGDVFLFVDPICHPMCLKVTQLL